MSRRTRVRRRRAVALLVLAVGTVGLLSGPVANAVGLNREEAGAAQTYVVRPGDTLWEIASRLEPSVDPRDVVHAIGVANDVEAGSLVPGSELRIPSLG